MGIEVVEIQDIPKYAEDDDEEGAEADFSSGHLGALAC